MKMLCAAWCEGHSTDPKLMIVMVMIVIVILLPFHFHHNFSNNVFELKPVLLENPRRGLSIRLLIQPFVHLARTVLSS